MAKMRLDKNVAGARGNVSQKAFVAKSRQESLVVEIEDSVASTKEGAASAAPAPVRSVQVAGDVGRQRSTRGADPRQEEKNEVAEIAPGLVGPMFPAVTDVAAVAA